MANGRDKNNANLNLEQRFLAARRSFRSVVRRTRSALKSSHECILLDQQVDGPPQKESLDGDDARAGMDVGLFLFGTIGIGAERIGSDIDVGLRGVENQLEEIRSEIATLLDDSEGRAAGGSGGACSKDVNASSGEDECVASGGSTDGSSDEADGNGDFFPADDVPILQRHVSFLQDCVCASKLLGEAEMLSSSTDFASSGGRSSIDISCDAFTHSPSSICSPSDFVRFTFDSRPLEGVAALGVGEVGGPSPMVRAAELVGRTENILDRATDELRHDGRCAEGDRLFPTQMGMQAELIEGLRHQMLQRKAELRHRAATLVSTFVVVKEDELIVRGSGTDTFAEEPGESGGLHPLSEAYRVLDILSDPNLPGHGKGLDGAVERLSRELLDVALLPCLRKLLEPTPRYEEGAARYYKFAQDTLMRGSGCGAGNRWRDSVRVGDQAARLGWSMISVAPGGKCGGKDHSAEERLATTDELDEGVLRTKPTGLAGFTAALNFLANILTFIYEHALLQRPGLSAMLGGRLFGTTSFSRLALISFGFNNEIPEGVDQPLMAYMLKGYRRCIPQEGMPGAQNKLCEVARHLAPEVRAFEERMVGMGFMGASTGDGGVSAVLNKPMTPSSRSSSLTGLSVIVDNDSTIVHSPIHPNIMLSNLTAMDTTFPMSSSCPIFMPDSESEGPKKSILPLTEFARSLGQAYVEGQRLDVLRRGRALLLSTDYRDTIRVGEGRMPVSCVHGSLESVFTLHQCSVSLAAKQILDLCRETLDAATVDFGPDLVRCLGDDNGNVFNGMNSLRPTLYRAARELLDLFRAIVPTLHASEVWNVPRTAAVLHNDCVYLAHESLLLGAEYKFKFRSLNPTCEKTKLLGEVCSFVDMVPLFRDLATKSMGSMIELQKGQLYELVESYLVNLRGALASNESVSEWDDADSALRAALHHLRYLSLTWEKVLPHGVYNASVGNLVDTILSLFLDPILRAEDISEPASRFVHSLFLDAARSTAEAFFTEGGVSNFNGDGGITAEVLSTGVVFTQQQQQHLEEIRKHSYLFDKLQAVGRFMSMRLDDIQRGLEEGLFLSVTARELSQLILATFDESEKRTVLLNGLASK